MQTSEPTLGLEQRCFLPTAWPLSRLENLPAAQLSAETRNVIEAFKQNISGALQTLSLPYSLTLNMVLMHRFHNHLAAARIRRLKSTPPEGDAAAEAAAAMREEFPSLSRTYPYTATELGDQATEAVMTALADTIDGLPVVSQELLRQGIVVIWGSVEVLVRDFFCALLRTHTSLAESVLRSGELVKHFELDRLKVSDLASVNFELKARLDEVLFSRRDVNTIPSMKVVFGELFPLHAPLRRALAQKQLWNLAQQRHLIVHKRAIIDREFLVATGATLEPSLPLVITSEDIRLSLDAALELAIQLISAAGNGEEE